MTSIEESVSVLRARVTASLPFATRSDRRFFRTYVDKVVLPALVEVLHRLIQRRHHFDRTENLAVHYTSIPSLVSILIDGSIRPYDSNQSNDPNEGRLFSDYLSLPDSLSWARPGRPSHAYISSFVISPRDNHQTDELLYWRTYGHDGMGCSIAITAPHNRFYRVLYGRDQVEDTCNSLIPVLEVISPLSQVDEEMEWIVSREVWKALGAIRFLYKSEDYRYEKECRFVVPNISIGEEDICFAQSSALDEPSRIRHYYNRGDIHLRDLLQSDSSITLGPTLSDTTEVKRAVRLLLRKLKRELQEVPINDSRITYQGS